MTDRPRAEPRGELRRPTWDDVNENPDILFKPDEALSIDSTRSWVDPNGYRLSDRVWRSGQYDRQQIDTELQRSLAAGLGPEKTARNLEAFLSPAGAEMRKRSPRAGMGNYAARRLARTETTRAFGDALKKSSALNPFVKGMKWLISGSHEDIDRCDEYAQRSSGKGWGPGEYAIDDTPPYPSHPNELCTLATVDVGDEEASAITRQMMNGLQASEEAEKAAAPMGLSPASIKNADTARDYFRSIGVEVGQFSGSARVFRLVAEAYTKEVAAGMAVPPRLSFVGGGKRTVASYSRAINAMTGELVDDRINIYPSNKFWKNPEAVSQELAATEYLVSPSTDGIITHEFGHWRHAQEVTQDRWGGAYRVNRTGERIDSWRYDSPEKQIANRVSRYAATKPEEFVAEVYSGMRTGKTFDREITELYRKLGGPEA